MLPEAPSPRGHQSSCRCMNGAGPRPQRVRCCSSRPRSHTECSGAAGFQLGFSATRSGGARAMATCNPDHYHCYGVIAVPEEGVEPLGPQTPGSPTSAHEPPSCNMKQVCAALVDNKVDGPNQSDDRDEEQHVPRKSTASSPKDVNAAVRCASLSSSTHCHGDYSPLTYPIKRM